MITIQKGLDVPLAGNPDQVIHNDLTVSEVAITGSSFNNLKPSLKVREGDKVIKGQVLMVDKKLPAVTFTAPCSGTVKTVNRGERRVFQSLVITVNQDSTEEVTFTSYTEDSLKGKAEEIKQTLLEAGLWLAFRTRPFNNIANYNESPAALFVNAHDTNPGHACPNVVIEADKEFFDFGLTVLSELFADVKDKFVVGNAKFNPTNKVSGFTYEQFDGPHPAGLVGTHINYLSPVSANRHAWHLNYQDVIQIGKLFKNGKVDFTKVIALSGPQVASPTLYRVPYGASVADVTVNKLVEAKHPNRIISGSCLDGVTAQGPFAYLGYYDLQLTVLEEGYEQFLLGWITPQPKKFSLSRLNFFGKKDLKLTTTTNGSNRGMVPIGLYERVMPLKDIYPTLLLRDIITCDTDSAQELGILELAEEDVALCSFVCQGKYDYALYLRKALNKIEKEG